MPADWSINFWPPIGCHAFLSYCREDRDKLVLPVYEELKKLSIIPWIDKHQFPSGRDGIESLREELLRCRHVVYFITPALLGQGRGWSAVERTYSELMQRRATYSGTEFQHVELPLVFPDPSHPVLPRSIWFPTLGRAQFFQHSRKPRQTRVQWAVEKIRDFLKQEELWTEDIRKRLKYDVQSHQHFSAPHGLLERIRGSAPLPQVQ